MSQPNPNTLSAPLSADTARLAAEHSADPILELDDAGRVRAFNPAALHELRYAAGQLVGQHFVDLLDDGSREKGRAMLAAAPGGPTAIYELNHVAGDGTIVLVGYRAVPLPADATRPADGVLLVGHLLSATVTTTERLIALNRRLNTLFAIGAVASRSLVSADMLREVLGLTLAELGAQAGVVLVAATPRASPRQPAPPNVAPLPLRLAAQHGFAPLAAERLAARPPAPIASRAEFRRGEPFVIRGDSAELGLAPGDLHARVGPLLSLAAVPLRGENQLLGWIYAISDHYRAFDGGALDLIGTIGDLLGPPLRNARLYGELLETSGQLGAVLDSIDSGVLLIDNAGVVRYANARLGELFQVDVRAWPGQPRAALLDTLLVPIEQPRPSAQIYGELWATTGPRRRVLRRFTDRVKGTNADQDGTIEVYGDVTEIHQMDQLKDEFVAAAAHDLKTPVTAVKGYTQIALRLARRGADQRLIQQLEMINARSDELAYLMETLLDMSRIQAGRLRLDVESIALDDLVARVVRHFDFDLRRRQRALSIELPAEPIVVRWDGLRIERVLINLVGNALKYSPNGGPVELRARSLSPREGPDLVELSVTDYGIGIPADEREQIFTRFYRGRQALADAFKGSGLGLYICRGVVEAHHGRIWAADALHGGPGTTVFVTLPRRLDVSPSTLA